MPTKRYKHNNPEGLPPAPTCEEALNTLRSIVVLYQRQGIITFPVDLNNALTGQVLFHSGLETAAPVGTPKLRTAAAPKEKSFPLPRGMKLKLAQETTPNGVAQVIFDFRMKRKYTFAQSNSTSFQNYCIQLCGKKDIKQDSVWQALQRIGCKHDRD